MDRKKLVRVVALILVLSLFASLVPAAVIAMLG